MHLEELARASAEVAEITARRAKVERLAACLRGRPPGVQASARYPGGLALRFARVKGHRPDKRPDEADTIDTVRAIHQGSG